MLLLLTGSAERVLDFFELYKKREEHAVYQVSIHAVYQVSIHVYACSLSSLHTMQTCSPDCVGCKKCRILAMGAIQAVNVPQQSPLPEGY